MKSFHLAAVLLVLAIGGSSAVGQDHVASVPRGTAQPSPQPTSPGQAALARAAAANKYALVFFWKEKNPQTDRAWSALQPAAAKVADSAEVISIQATSAAERSVVDRLGVGRAPMPLVLAVAPSGAITRAFTAPVDEKQVCTAFVSRGTQLCLKGLQDRKLVFVCVIEPTSPAEIPAGVRDFRADARYGRATEVVVLNAQDEAEASFLRQLQVDSRTPKPVAVFLAPPGSVIGKFDAASTKEQLVAALSAAQSNPCAGGKCGPNGCGPKK